MNGSAAMSAAMSAVPAAPGRRTAYAYPSYRTPGISASKRKAGPSRQDADHPRQRVGIDRRITTSAAGGGADASMRDNGIVRALIAANFASAANCIDHAAYGTAPSECALTPKFSVSVIRR